MRKPSRRQFLTNAGKAAAVTAITPFLAGRSARAAANENAEGPFIHHVYFWLKNATSQDDKAKLVAGLKKLSAASTIDRFYIGQPAPTNRDVIDRSYAVSWLLFFKNKADQDAYQTDPIHLKFIEECSSLWSKVIVYDSVDV
ncbi:Dabb family protein [Chitinophaga sedimenti]|uniref:Dabb family protein n=1 Tax=Chitinophaga sedimenti TaxID=2033606 RepID=UPI0020063F8F|nr:Dabb family protein [Chitinophaga sedimenti]MCK7554516.1 Dabb family protein [Chitinophaga sedimenti]